MKLRSDTLFCVKCLTYGNLFVGGNSQTPAHCPNCGEVLLRRFEDFSTEERLMILEEH